MRWETAQDPFDAADGLDLEVSTQLAAVLKSQLDPYPDELTEMYPISKRVDDPGNEQPDIIEPIDIGEQSGLGEF